MTTEITWKTGNGMTATVTIKQITEETINADGNKITVPACDYSILTTLDGKREGYELRELKGVPGYTGKVGRLAIPEAKMEEINATIREIESTPEWTEKMEGEWIAMLQEVEYQRHSEKMAKIMGK